MAEHLLMLLERTTQHAFSKNQSTSSLQEALSVIKSYKTQV